MAMRLVSRAAAILVGGLVANEPLSGGESQPRHVTYVAPGRHGCAQAGADR
jgi:hypothetical protein